MGEARATAQKAPTSKLSMLTKGKMVKSKRGRDDLRSRLEDECSLLPLYLSRADRPLSLGRGRLLLRRLDLAVKLCQIKATLA